MDNIYIVIYSFKKELRTFTVLSAEYTIDEQVSVPILKYHTTL